AVIEELDSVVWRGVVRRPDDGTGHELICLREIREPGCWNMPDQAHLHADRTQPRGERALEHAAASAGVTPDDHRMARPAEDVPGRPAEPKREIRGEVGSREAGDAGGEGEPSADDPDVVVCV